MKTIRVLLFAATVAATAVCEAQFLDTFDDGSNEEWLYYTGDGDAEVAFTSMDGVARISVDATNDQHNVWWAIIKRDVAPFLDLDKLKDPRYELRVEAKVRVSDAPRRINFMINTQRTTDFHEHLREYDIANTTSWHTISMTTKALDAVPGDSLFVQLGVTDWGLDKYHVDLEYYRADIVDTTVADPDVGEPLVYHPPVPSLDTFSQHVDVAHDSMINNDFPDVNFNDWSAASHGSDARLLSVGASQFPILRWDFAPYEGQAADGPGILELTTFSVSKGGNYVDVFGEDLGIEFGKARVIEILAGDPRWNQESVTYTSLTEGRDLSDVINGQMIFDTELSSDRGGKTFVTLSRPVMQRLLDGTTKGLIFCPLGAIDASLYASETSEGPVLHFNVKP